MYNALIRTHHITSLKKISALRKAAHSHACYVLLRSNGGGKALVPGIMYCEGPESGVKEWVNTVQRLRYKDYQLVSKPAQVVVEDQMDCGKEERNLRWGNLEEVESVKEFGAKMQDFGVWAWWRRGMGYLND